MRQMLAKRRRHSPAEDAKWRELDELLRTEWQLVEERRELKTQYREILSSLAAAFDGHLQEMADSICAIRERIDELECLGYKRAAGWSGINDKRPPLSKCLPKMSAAGTGVRSGPESLLPAMPAPSAGDISAPSSALGGACDGDARNRIKTEQVLPKKRPAVRPLMSWPPLPPPVHTSSGSSASEAGNGSMSAMRTSLAEGAIWF